MDPHNDFDKQDREPVRCRCGHERDDHDSRTEMRRGEKAYIQNCAHCQCEVFVDANGPLSRMMNSIPVYPTAIHYELDGPAGGARGCTQANQRTPQSTGTLNELEAPRAANVVLDTENAKLRQALRVIRKGLSDSQDGEFWTARNWLDRRGIYHGDLSGLRVLELVARHALHAKAEGK